ncbi:maltase A3-like [Acyrthosiphon pisum]|uniref:alpha-glucosidase n=1 Tax=Acyrthosiphon pisum TaxID=7029 RepID=A0A8R1VZX1_ACYPI|nr:maltase A3-like [Acyrthosiphon pisum]
MSFVIFLCCIILGVKAGINEIVDLHHEEISSIESNKIFSRTFNFLQNLENEVIEDYIESISNKYDFLSKKNKTNLDWWQTGIIYEIYPRSFMDSTGNGVGDLRGIIEKIPYLKYLGISAVWLTPIYPSPGRDMGYDITNYRGIDELMGTMEDFDELMEKLHESGIKVILDIVPNHTSDEHEWFVKSVQSIEPYTDYYIWADAKYVNGTRQVPNNWESVFGNSMWEWNETRQKYYLHQFLKQQPDLNFWNPLVREEIKDMMRFWLDKGVDGFRFDAVEHLYERQDLLDAPILDNGQLQTINYTQGLDEVYYEVYDWRSLLEEYKKKDDQTRFMVTESYVELKYLMKYYGNETNLGAHFPFNVCLLGLPHRSAKEFLEMLTEWMSNLPSGAWSNWVVRIIV